MLDLNKTIDNSHLFGSSFSDASPYGHLTPDDLGKNDVFTHCPFLQSDSFLVALLRKFKNFSY
jgi:hypothetical protein